MSLPPPNDGGSPTQLYDYLGSLWRRCWLVALAVLATAGTTVSFSSRRPFVYEAKARVFIGPRAVVSGDIGAALEELTFSREFIASYAKLLKSRPLATRVVKLESLPYSGADLSDHIRTRIISDTRIIEVAVADGEAQRARRVANALTETFVREGVEEFGGAAGVRASVLEPALLPRQPVSPKPTQDAVLGALLGLLIGVAAASLLGYLDDTLRFRKQVDATLAPLPVLAALPRIRRGRKRLVFDRNLQSPVAEAFRSLRTSIQLSALDVPVPRVLVTSPSAEDGKTFVAANLAASLAMGGVRTVLVGTDLRRPMVHEHLRAARSPGVTEVVAGTADLAHALYQTPLSNLALLPAGKACPNPSELLGSQAMADMLDELSTQAEILVLDSPPVLAVTDAAVLATCTDGVVLVLRAGQTHLGWAQEVKATLDRVGVPILGVVLNEVKKDDVYSYYRSYRRKYAKNDVKGTRRAREEKVFSSELRPAALQRLRAVRAACSRAAGEGGHNGDDSPASNGAGGCRPASSDGNPLEALPPRHIDLRTQEMPPYPRHRGDD